FTPASTGVFLYICAASIISYSLWNILLKSNSVSKLSIIKFTEPLFAVIFSGFILGEKIFRVSYLVAFVLLIAALIIEHKEKKIKN
ncbi:MAG: EamA family transporter, partial [Clostridia bacterium]|nr:EamA family transporter [Clostridia bacterium]